MKKLDIPFILGKHYELWEFDLEVVQDSIQGCESYIYIGKRFNKFLNYPTDRTELIFSFDILEIIIITFQNRYSMYEELCNLISEKLKCSPEVVLKDNLLMSRFTTKTNEVWCVKNNSNIFVIIVKASYPEDVIYKLLEY
ncbi:hypothetical protein [Flavobacterium sp.]|uniref:hypothetical protein n=1 Tax=Flavobacterium sp. TaxID=239 RepID=UPI002FDD17F8